jgi:hypothetical protein
MESRVIDLSMRLRDVKRKIIATTTKPEIKK